MIPYSRQEITEEDIAEVEKVLRSDFLTQGPIVPKFEQSVAKYCGASFGVAVNSATSALHIACLAPDLGPGDLLWTSPNTFVASANCALYCGADIDFVDIDPDTFNMSVDSLSSKLKKAEKLGRLPKIVIPVHFGGQPSDMHKIYDLSTQYGFKIIEDASHAIGASYKHIKVGSCFHSDITVFSFHPVKIITTGEGGMALTNNDKIAKVMRRLSTHGITKDKSLFKSRPDNEIWNYQQIQLGFNYRMNDIEAALGLSQMSRLDKFVRRRQEIAKYYNKQFANLPIESQKQLPDTYSSYHLFTICLNSSNTQKTQKKIFEVLLQDGIAANLHYIPVHRQPFYEKLGFKQGDFPFSEKFYKEAISLPIFSSLKNVDNSKVVSALLKIFESNEY